MSDNEMYFYIIVYHSGVILYQNILIANLYNRYYIVRKKWLQLIVLLKLAMGTRRRMPTVTG
jgi:hypothetical protein